MGKGTHEFRHFQAGILSSQKFKDEVKVICKTESRHINSLANIANSGYDALFAEIELLKEEIKKLKETKDWFSLLKESVANFELKK